jgi:hypothetical protein
MFEYDSKRYTESEVKKQGLGPRQKKNSKGELLFLGKSDATKDRTNGGAGFTRDEIYSQFNHYRSYEFQTYVGDEANFLMEDPLRPVLEPQRYSRHHIDGRCLEAKKHLGQIQSHIRGLEAHMAKLAETVDNHLWVQPGFSVVAKRNLEEAKTEATKLEGRMQAALDGFSKLPVLVEETVE